MDTYILIMNNGNEYEDYREFNKGVFLSKELAVEFAKTQSEINWGFKIEKWNVSNSPVSIAGTYRFVKEGNKIFELVEIT